MGLHQTKSFFTAKEYIKKDHAFGGHTFYQSLPLLGIIGDRKTDIRIREYGLERYLRKDTDVLDIGSNSGFFDLEISEKVNSVTGVEYIKSLSDVGKTVAEHMNIDNVKFICDDYNKWQDDNKKRYDLIFSFAVHIWIDVSPERYALQLYDMLKDKGHIILESQTMESDSLFEEYAENMEKAGLSMIHTGVLKDDGVTNRKFYIFEKNK